MVEILNNAIEQHYVQRHHHMIIHVTLTYYL